MLASAGVSAKSLVTVKGTVPAGTTGKVYLQKYNDKVFETIDSVSIVDGEFLLSDSLDIPELYGISLDQNEVPYYLFIDSKETTVALNPERGYSLSKTTGSALQDEYLAYKSQHVTDISAYISQHPSSLVSAYVLCRDFAYRLSPEQIEHNISLLDASLQGTVYIETLRKVAKTASEVAVGRQAPDFSALTPDGKQLSLSEVIDKNKYVLIDFWASWCGPCRKENPNVVKAYDKYHDKGFTVLGVSIDRNGDAWRQAIADDSLNWYHVSDLKFWASGPAKLYGVRVIPSNFLVDATGKIIARNIKGEELFKTLESLF